MGSLFGVILFLVGSGVLTWGLAMTFNPLASRGATIAWLGFGFVLCVAGYLMKELGEIAPNTSRAIDKFFGAIFFLLGLATLSGSLCIGTVDKFTLLNIVRIIASLVFCGIGYFLVAFKGTEG